MASHPEDHVLFVVRYEDGHTEQMSIHTWILSRGDHVAKIIAGEHQRAGMLAEGKIVSIARMAGQRPAYRRIDRGRN